MVIATSHSCVSAGNHSHEGNRLSAPPLHKFMEMDTTHSSVPPKVFSYTRIINTGNYISAKQKLSVLSVLQGDASGSPGPAASQGECSEELR